MIIRHRINERDELNQISPKFGVEIDLRLFNGEIVLAHDPFIKGENFDEWLVNFHHQILILNVKEDGLEATIIEILKQRGILNYFFLDQPFPTLRKSALAKHPVAVRISEYENPIDFRDLVVQWIWLDSFTGEWDYLTKHSNWIKDSGSNLCIVSPELQGRPPLNESQEIIALFSRLGLPLNAVCTKYPEIWEKYF